MPSAIKCIISFNPQVNFIRQFSIIAESWGLEADCLDTLLSALLNSCVTSSVYTSIERDNNSTQLLSEWFELITCRIPESKFSFKKMCVLLPSFSRWENWDSEILNNLPESHSWGRTEVWLEPSAIRSWSPWSSDYSSRRLNYQDC